jgi:hypothetical protein
MRPRYKVSALMGTAALALALAGCGGSSDASSDGQGGGGAPQGGAPLTVTEPKDGASVQVPFTLKFTSNTEIGPEESGKNHVHVFLDGKENDYEVVTATEYQIENLTPGKHTIGVALQHADHSPVGPTTQLTVNVTGGGGGGGDTGGGGGGGGYDYGGGGGGGY